MKKLAWLPLCLLLAFPFTAKASTPARFDLPVLTTTPAQVPVGSLPSLLAVTNATISVCGYPAVLSNGVCTNTITTYTSSTLGTACPATAQLTVNGTSVCVSTSGLQGSFGFWYDSSVQTHMTYTVQTAWGTFGPYDILQGAGGGGSGTTTNFTSQATVAPLFTTSVTNPTTTPNLSFTLSNFAPHTFYGNNSSSTGLPGANLLGVSDWSPNAFVAGSGSAQVQTITLTPAATALTPGLAVCWLPIAANNATAPTLNVNGLGARVITKFGTSGLIASDLTATAIACAKYDGSVWQLQNPQTASAGGSFITSLTTTGTSGASTVVGGVLNVPQYSGGGSLPTATAPGQIPVASAAGTTYTAQLQALELKNTANPKLATWLQAFHNCNNQAVHVALFADSQGMVDQGNSSSGPTVATNRYADQLRTYFSNQCGSHGTGVTPIWGFLIPGSPNPVNDNWTKTGTIAQSSILGPSQNSTLGAYAGTLLGAVTNMSTGAVLTFTSPWAYDHVNLYYVQTPSAVSIAVAVDGSGVGTITSTAGSNTAALFTSTSFASTTHTATITCTTGPCYVYGMEGTNGTTGVSVDNLSLSAGVAENYSGATGSTPFAFADLIPGGIQLAIEAYGTNEPGLGYSQASYGSAIASIVNHEVAQSNSSVLITSPPVNNQATYGAQMVAYASTALAQATALNTGYVSYIDNWGTGYVSSLFGSDGVHPNDKGNLSEYSMIKNAVIDTDVTSGTSLPANIAYTNAANTFTQNQTVSGTSARFIGRGSATSTLTAIEMDASLNTTNSGQDWFIWAQSTAGQNGLVFLSNAFGGPGVATLNQIDATHAKFSMGSLGDIGWSSNNAANANSSLIDTGLSRDSADAVDVGNGTALDKSGTLNLSVLNATGNISTSATAAANSGANVNSPNMNFIGHYWNGAASANDTWNCFNNLGIWSGSDTNPQSRLDCEHTGSSGGGNFYTPAMQTVNLIASGISMYGGTVNLNGSGASTSSNNYSSSILNFQGSYWTGAANATDDFALQDVEGTGSNPTQTLTLTRTGPSTGRQLIDLSVEPIKLGATGLPIFTVAGLPSASSLNTGSMVEVSDATTYTPGTCTGGGSDYMIAITNGTTWSCH